ncbi:hypothetical protein ABZ070_24005 [Streptomyces sp. NPDC006283]|uniref:hypothetical protein n=1 Tax=Streptomyces sp. NPDC006283 TaxID=3156741 RepID=UPI0033B8CAEF
MLTFEQVRDWVRGKYGPRYAERRISDSGFAYLVATQPDAYFDGGDMLYGNGPDLVVKRTGAVWQFGSHPMFLPLYEAGTEDDFRRRMAAILPGWDPDRPQETIPLPVSPTPMSPPAASPPHAPAPPGFGPPLPLHPPAAPMYAPGVYAPAPPVLPEGPEFLAADARNAVLVDAAGIAFDQEGRRADFAWSEIQTVHHTSRGSCLLVGVVHANGMFYECRVGARRQARLREWCAQIAPVLGFYLGGRTV